MAIQSQHHLISAERPHYISEHDMCIFHTRLLFRSYSTYELFSGVLFKALKKFKKKFKQKLKKVSFYV